ncbi:MAG: 50S ribosomal protein L4 [bacterium]|nr:50S ribosomal protein L4 [bacterium]
MQKAAEFNKNLFAGEVKQELVSQAVRVFLSNQRQATAKTKTRSEINRTKKKWFKQKGTGNARHGAQTPNIFVGGGVAHGPTGTQNYNLKLSAKMKKQALLSALALQADHIFVDDAFTKVDGKTKTAAKILAESLKNDARVLLVVDQKNADLMRSYNNLSQVYLITARYLSLLPVVNADQIIFSTAGAQALAARLLGEEK